MKIQDRGVRRQIVDLAEQLAKGERSAQSAEDRRAKAAATR